MQSNEIRIGNLISFKGKWNGEVIAITDGAIYIKDNGGIFPYDVFQPIPITEEWLIKLGFEYRNENRGFGAILDFIPYTKDENKHYWKYAKSVALVHDKDNVDDVYYTFLANPTAYKLKYIHQLQNLYFALTGEELVSIDTIKPLI